MSNQVISEPGDERSFPTFEQWVIRDAAWKAKYEVKLDALMSAVRKTDDVLKDFCESFNEHKEQDVAEFTDIRARQRESEQSIELLTSSLTQLSDKVGKLDVMLNKHVARMTIVLAIANFIATAAGAKVFQLIFG